MAKRGSRPKSTTKTITFNGIEYHLRRGAPYYHSNIGGYLHRAIWEHQHGSIPDGYEIHHKDETRPTTLSTILNAFCEGNIEDCMLPRSGKESILLEFAHWRLIGIEQRKAEQPPAGQESVIGKSSRTAIIDVNSVANCLHPMGQSLSFVPSNVWKNTITTPVLILKLESVSNAEVCLKHREEKQSAVLGNAQHVSDGSIAVYNLEVEEYPEYYANGILVHNSWDVQAWIDELCAFPHGQLLDRPDSASGAFNWLIGRTRQQGVNVVQSRTIRLGKREGPRILFMDAAEASQVMIEEPTLLVQILSPNREEEISHGLNKCLGQVLIQFADVDPADHQESWQVPISPFDLPCEKIMARAEHAKAMWECLLKSHSPTKSEVIVVIDDTDGKRAQSAAMAICDAMGLPRPLHLSRPDEAWVAGKTDPPFNRHVYDTLKKGRWSVSGR